MKHPAGILLLLLLTSLAFPVSSAASDPCDFVSGGAVGFTREQVIACFESVPFRHDDLQNILAVIRQHRSFSDLAELYDERVGWVERLNALDDPETEEDFPSDFAMHEALKAEHKAFLDPHIRYQPPRCYWQMLAAFVPFDFGATTRFLEDGESQIVFIESASIRPDLYRYVTGIEEAPEGLWRDDGELDRERRLFAQQRIGGPQVTDKDFFEVPPGLVGQNIEVIVPPTDNAIVLQYKRNITAIRLWNTVDWIDVVRTGIEHACQNSERLILDLRRNGGGNDTVTRWLYHHLFPEDDELAEAKSVMGLRNDRAALNEFLFNSARFDNLLVPLGFPPCAVGLGPACFTDLTTGDPLPLDELDWFQEPSILEWRGGAPGRPFPPTSGPGKRPGWSTTRADGSRSRPTTRRPSAGCSATWKRGGCTARPTAPPSTSTSRWRPICASTCGRIPS